MVAWGACMVARGCEWLLGGVHGCRGCVHGYWGACMVVGGACMVMGGMHGEAVCMAKRGHAMQRGCAW